MSPNLKMFMNDCGDSIPKNRLLWRNEFYRIELSDFSEKQFLDMELGYSFFVYKFAVSDRSGKQY
jgi:hypothetical protein